MKLPSPSTLSVIFISWPVVKGSGWLGVLACWWWLLVKPSGGHWPFRTVAGQGSTIVGSGTGYDSWVAGSVIVAAVVVLFSGSEEDKDKGVKKRIHTGSLSAAAIQRAQYATGVESVAQGRKIRDGDKRRWEIKDLSPQHQQRSKSHCVNSAPRGRALQPGWKWKLSGWASY